MLLNFTLSLSIRPESGNQRVAKIQMAMVQQQVVQRIPAQTTITTAAQTITTQLFKIQPMVSQNEKLFFFNVIKTYEFSFIKFSELRNLTAALHQPVTTTIIHGQNSPPSMNGSVSQVDSNQTPPLSPHSYTGQIPSPIFTSSTPNTTMNNTRATNYLQPYVSVPQSQSMVEMYSSAAYSPITSPYYTLTPGNLLAEHEVKIEGMPHTSPHSVHSHHHQMTHMTAPHQNHSRSPSIEDERELQSQIVSRNLERPSVVNIKME